ncbi:hypothetical protein DFH28DRAFT_922108 [Melampsora americana]|nr:hypothetical protein DFH28DRAFT_922108 [Melampsora americana]
MNRQCDCAKCFKIHGTNGPAVTLVTIRRHHKQNGVSPRQTDPQQLPPSDPPPPSAFQSPDESQESAENPQESPQDVVSSAHNEIIRTSLQSFGSLGNQFSSPSELETPYLDQAMGFSNNDTQLSSTTSQQVGNSSLTPCTLTVLEELPDEDEMDDIYDDDGNLLAAIQASSLHDDLLTSEALRTIRSAIISSSIPSWMNPPPSNLGSASHGNLRSSDWVVLVTVHLTFAIFQLNDLGMIDSEVAKNHFYYGPSAYLAAWQFEQYNGILQNVPNNRKIWELDLTMIRQICRASNLAVALDSPDLPECVREVSPLMQCGKKLASAIGEVPLENINPTSSRKTTILLDMPDNLCSATYNALLHTVQLSNPTIHHQFSKSSQGELLSSRVKYVKQIPWSSHSLTTHEYSSKNGIIEYDTSANPGTPAFGQILKIFHHVRHCTTSGEDKQEAFLSVLQYRHLNERDTLHNPFKSWPDLNTHLFYTNPSNARLPQDLGLSPELVPEVIHLHQLWHPTPNHHSKVTESRSSYVVVTNSGMSNFNSIHPNSKDLSHCVVGRLL